MNRFNLLLLVCVTILLSSLASATIPTPYAYYNFSETTGTIGVDQMNRANLTNLTASHFTTNGKVFRGYNVSLETAFSINDLNVSTNWSIAFWINQSALTANGEVLLGTGNFGNTNHSKFYLTLDNNRKIYFNGYDGTSASTNIVNPLNLGQWNFVVVTISSGSVKIYVNNTLETETNSFVYTGFNVTNLTFFNIQESGSPLTAKVGIDEIGIWNQTLTSSNIDELYKDGFGDSYPFTTLFENSQTYNNITSIGANENFIINMTYDSSFYPSVVGILTYNGTNYTGVKIGNSNNILFNTTITIPLITVPEQNNTFYWTIATTNAFGTVYYRSNNINQTVRRVTVDSCGTNTNRAYNFTMFDEESLAFLTGSTYNTSIEISLTLYSSSGETVLNYSNNFTKINPVSICFSTNLNTTTLLSDVSLRYDADPYVSKFYNEQRVSLNNNTIPRNIPLYNLLSSRSQEFKMTFKDASLLPLADYLVQVNKKYLSENVYKTVEIGKTDGDGLTLGHFVLSDAYYRLTLTKDNNIIHIYPDFQASCDNVALGECALTKYIFTASPRVEGVYVQDGIEYTQLSYNETTRVLTSTFTVIDGSSQTITLNATDTRGREIVSNTLTSSTGTLSVTLPELIVGGGTSNLTVIAILHKGTKVLTNGFISLHEKPTNLYGNSRIILALGIVMTLIGMTISSGGITLVMFILGIVLSGSLGLVSALGTVSVLGIGGAFLAGIVFVVVFLIHKSRTGGGDI